VRRGEENHLLDCEVYNSALADYLGLSRMTEDQWKHLAAERGLSIVGTIATALAGLIPGRRAGGHVPRPMAFDAGKANRRLRGLTTSTVAINSQIRSYGKTVLARSRYLAANNPVCCGREGNLCLRAGR
jgi:hypothetical protein